VYSNKKLDDLDSGEILLFFGITLKKKAFSCKIDVVKIIDKVVKLISKDCE